jgi:hypothetical protein
MNERDTANVMLTKLVHGTEIGDKVVMIEPW